METLLRPGNIIIAIRALVVFFLFTQTLQAQTIYYIRPGGTGTGTGSWSNAAGGATTLQSVIDAAASGSQVWVAAGTYLPAAYPAGSTGGASNRDYAFALKNGVSVYGGFAGTETALNQRDPSANPTILSGEIGSAATSDNCYHVVLSVGNDNTALLDGFTVQSGNANGSGTLIYHAAAIDRSYGGGLYCNASSLVINNCIVTNNKATDGAGMALIGGSANIGNTQITSNVANGFGGGIYISSATPVVRSCSLTNNSAGIGGGICNMAGAGVFSDDNISHNTSNNAGNYGGGAVFNDNANPTMIRCVFLGDVTSGGGDGGAIYNFNSSCVDSNCIFKDDITKFGNGGAIFNIDGNSECWNCVFVNNSSHSNGGAVYFTSDNGKVINSTFYKNAATYNNSGDPAGATGGGVYIADGNPILSNNIIWGGSSGLVVVSGSPVVIYNDIQDGAYTTNGNISSDPLFVSASANPIGGDGIWGTGDDGLQLINGPTAAVASPAINTGTNTAGNSITYDLLYVARPVGPGIDMGAYEAPLPVTLGVMSLLNFTATTAGPRSTLLQWHVDAQQQASAYEVQRSMNGLDFTDIGMLSTVRDKTDYSFIDADAGSGNAFYRLKWLQGNNKPDYSIELVVNHSPVTGHLSLRPSVIDHGGSTVLFLESSSGTDMELRIIDASGRLCRHQTVSINQGDNELPLDVSSFARGLYYVDVRLKNDFHQVVELVKL